MGLEQLLRRPFDSRVRGRLALRATRSPRRHPSGVAVTAGGVAWLALGVLYLWCPVHRFPPARPFHGRRWYNPYASIEPGSTWHKANLHVHSRAWAGLTNGRGTPEDVQRRYRELGYDVAPISNYQQIARVDAKDATSVTAYEHGYNLRKTHFLAVGARSVDWLDYPLLQGRDEEQHRIDRLRESGGLVIIAHPRLRHAIADADLRALTGYAAIEIGSNEERSVDAWDVALDAGRAVWGVANDDIHDADAPNEAGRYWSMIAAPSTQIGPLRSALADGRSYAVFGRHGRADVSLGSLTVVGDTMSVTFAGAPADVALVGPSGRLLALASQTHVARWFIPCDAPWVRVVARTPTTKLFLQPILRSEDGALPQLAATVDVTATLVRRALAVVLGLIALMSFVGRHQQRTAQTGLVRPSLFLRDAA